MQPPHHNKQVYLIPDFSRTVHKALGQCIFIFMSRRARLWAVSTTNATKDLGSLYLAHSPDVHPRTPSKRTAHACFVKPELAVYFCSHLLLFLYPKQNSSKENAGRHVHSSLAPAERGIAAVTNGSTPAGPAVAGPVQARDAPQEVASTTAPNGTGSKVAAESPRR